MSRGKAWWGLGRGQAGAETSLGGQQWRREKGWVYHAGLADGLQRRVRVRRRGKGLSVLAYVNPPVPEQKGVWGGAPEFWVL